MLLALPLQLAKADFSFDINRFRYDAVESPASNAEYLDTETIPVSWNETLAGSEVTVMTALSPTPLASFQTVQQKRDYLAGLSWRTLEAGLPNNGSFTLPAGSLEPDSTHLLLVMSNWGEWDTTGGEFTVTLDLPEIPCEPIEEVPQLTATMELSGGTWGTNAVWTDLVSQRQPPRTSPQADDIVLVSGSAGINTSATVAGLIVASGVTLTGNSGYLTVEGPLVNYGTITQSGTNNTTTKVTQGGAYNLGTWNNFSLKLEGGASAAARIPLQLMSSSPFGNTSLETNGYLELRGCATLPGYLNLGTADIRFDEPSKITLNQAYGNPVISGSGALEIQGTATGSQLGIKPDATDGPLQYLIFSGSGTQSIRINNNTGGGITAAKVRLVNGIKQLESTSATLTGDLDILSSATLRNSSSGSRDLTVTGSVRNYGTVSNYDGSKLLTLKVFGAVQNSGDWAPSFTELHGTAARSTTSAIPLQGNIKVMDSFELPGSLRLTDHLYFGVGSTPTYLSFPESLPQPRIEVTGNLYGSGGLDRGKLLINKAGTQLLQANLQADRIELSGSGLKRVYRQTFTGDLLVEAGTTLTTWSVRTDSVPLAGDPDKQQLPLP